MEFEIKLGLKRLNSSNDYYKGLIIQEEIKATFKIEEWIIEQLNR